MNDDTVHINGKPATDAQLRKLVGLDSVEDALWAKNNHVNSQPKTVRVEVKPSYWAKDDPTANINSGLVYRGFRGWTRA